MTKGHWPLIKVADLVSSGEAEIKTGPFGTQLKASSYVAHGTPVINVRNIGFGDIRPDKLEFIAEDTVARLSSHLLKRGDIVFGRKGAVERHALIRDAQNKWFQGSDCLRLRLQSQRVIPRFLSYYLLTHGHQEWMMQQCSHGATMASLNQDIVGRIEFRCPEPETQRRIASILSAYDDLIENNTRRIAILEEMARRIYEEWFVRFRFPGHENLRMVESVMGPVPDGWQLAALEDVATKIGSGATPRGGKSAYRDKGVTLIRSQNVYDYAFVDDGLAFIDDDQAASLDNVVVAQNDILLNITGASVARCCIVPRRHLPARVNQHVMIIRADTSKLDPHYLLMTINSPPRKQHLLSMARTGSTREALTKETMSRFDVVVPAPSVLKAFGDSVGAMFLLREILAQKIANLRTTRDLLLPRLISGELDVSALPEPEATAA